MKHIWEEGDLKPGTLIEYTKTDAPNRFSIIGYSVRRKSKIIVSLCDGNEFFDGEEGELIKLLNDGYAPVRVPMMPEDLVNREHKKLIW